MTNLSQKIKIAVTGGAGYIGSFTVNYLKKLGLKNLVILDNFSTGHREACFSRYYEVDLLDKRKLNEIFKKEGFDAVLHFAALIVVPHSMKNPYHYFHHNVNTSLSLLEIMKENKVRFIVFSSSCAVYDTPLKLPISEEESIKPESVYAETKAMIEKIIVWYKKIYKINYAILRYFNACGAAEDASNGEDHQPETHLIPSAIINLLNNRPIEIYGNDYQTKDRTCIRDYIHVNDLAAAHYLALKYIVEKGSSDIFNLGVGRGYSNIEVVRAILEEAKKYGITGKYLFKPRRWGDAPILYADNTKAKKLLHWKPQHTDIKEIVKGAFKWHKKRHLL